MPVCNLTTTIFAAVIGFGVLASPAYAKCRLTFIDGRSDQICDSTLDLPAIGVEGVAPIVPSSIAPIMVPTIPPIGTSACRQAQVWNGNAYVWRTVCS